MKKTKMQESFNRGYEQGKLNVVEQVYFFVERLKDSKVKNKIKEFLLKEFEEYVPIFGKTSPTAYEKKFCFVTTYTYRGIDVDIFEDDYGQCYYFYYNDESISCGTYNLDYESYVKYVIDRDLDKIMDFSIVDDKFFGAYCKYANHEHTKVAFTFRGELIDTYDIDENDKDSIIKICKKCENILIKLFEDPEFIKMEEERKANGNLYFSEMIDEVVK